MPRNNYVDLLKTIAIFGVVWIHGCWLLGGTPLLREFVSDIFRFAVPAFVVTWAYFFELGIQRRRERLVPYATARFKHLFVVFTFWSVIYFALNADWNNLTLLSSVTKHWSETGWSGQYFSIVLFQLVLIFPFLSYMFNHPVLRSIALVFCLMVYGWVGYFEWSVPPVILKFGYRPFVYWIPHVFLAIYLTRTESKPISFLAVCMLLIIPLESYFLKGNGMTHLPYVTTGILISSLIATVPFLTQHSREQPKAAQSFISFVGGNTMTVFVVNPLVIMLLNKIALQEKTSRFIMHGVLFDCALPFVSTCLVLLLSLSIATIINKTPFKGVVN